MPTLEQAPAVDGRHWSITPRIIQESTSIFWKGGRAARIIQEISGANVSWSSRAVFGKWRGNAHFGGRTVVCADEIVRGEESFAPRRAAVPSTATIRVWRQGL
jgi:hypothetical protein